MLIRKSTINDLPFITKLINDGRQKMISEGNTTQWTNGHPSNEQIISDIKNGVSHLIVDKQTQRHLATFALIKGPDPTYAQIYDGQWLNTLPYYVIHRVASAPGVHGIMRMVLEYAFHSPTPFASTLTRTTAPCVLFFSSMDSSIVAPYFWKMATLVWRIREP